MKSNLLAEATRRVTTQLEQLEKDRESLRAFSKLVTLGFTVEELNMMFRGYQIWSQLPDNTPAPPEVPPTEDEIRQAFYARVRVLFPIAVVEVAPRPSTSTPEVVIYTGLPATVLYQGPVTHHGPLPESTS